ncbi:MAG: hypothetical protein ACXADB_11430 [Candidatus Hermodarchaeia archaeon]|jgi:hypothetical protein
MDGLIERVLEENRGRSMDELHEEIDKAICEILSQEWAVGAMDRGHGHYSYAVIVKEPDPADRLENETDEEMLERLRHYRPPQLIVKCGAIKELAEHIVEIHNKGLGQ